MLDTIHKGLDIPGNVVNMCAIDFSKAFDRINHTVAIDKLIQLGVDRSILPVICSFLTNRSQTVQFCGATSNALDITCGVPQGTKLGPLIFLAVINDAACTVADRWKYVDDLTFLEVISKNDHSTL